MVGVTPKNLRSDSAAFLRAMLATGLCYGGSFYASRILRWLFSHRFVFSHDCFQTSVPVKYKFTLMALAGIGLVSLANGGSTQAEDALPPGAVQATLGPIEKTMTLPGHFSATQSTEIRVDLESSLVLKVRESVGHGTVVHAGDMLVEFEMEDAQDQVQQQEIALHMQRLALEEAESEHHVAEAKQQIDDATAERTKQRADEDFAFFMERAFPMSKKASEQSLQSMQDYLDYSAEELKQLEKMYKADDLTEESEEIVLRRAKDDFARSQFSFEQAQLNHQRSTQFGLDRSQADEKLAHRLAEIAYEQFRSLQPIVREKRNASLKKARLDLTKAERDFARLQADVEKLQVMAPHDGIVYFGKATDGKFANIADMSNKLRPHGNVAAHEVLMTVVRAGSLSFQCNLPESEMANAETSAAGYLIPTAFPGHRIAAKIQSVAEVPSADGTFGLQFQLKDSAPHRVVAGMTGHAHWVAHFNAKAVLVPSRMIHVDANENGATYLYALDSEFKPQKRRVKTGIVSGDQTEILEGLSSEEYVVETMTPAK